MLQHFTITNWKTGNHELEIYIETKNFDFDNVKVYDMMFNPITLNDRVLDICKREILHELHFGNKISTYWKDLKVKMGNSIKTPDFLL